MFGGYVGLSLLVGLVGVVATVYYKSYYGTVFSCHLGDLDLAGKVVIVTGANAGIGYHVALELAKRNARVILGCRSAEKGAQAREKIMKATGSNSVAVIGLDLSNMKKVVKFVDKVRESYGLVDVLINNAAMGLGNGEAGRQTTQEGLELLMATNHLGPLLLSTKILPLLAEDGKIISISSDSNLKCLGIDPDDLNSETSYQPSTLYAKTKLLNILMTRSLLDRLVGSQGAYSVDPGFTWTNIHSSQLPGPLGLLIYLVGPLLGATSPANACQTPVWLAGGGGENGEHYYDCQKSDKVNALAGDELLRQQAWNKSLELIDSVLYK